MCDAAELSVAVRVPHIEQVATVRREHAMNFPIGSVFLRQEHHAELADHKVKAAVRKREGHSVCGPEITASSGRNFVRDLDHRWIEVSGRQMDASGQMIAQLARNNPGTGCSLQHARRIARRRSARKCRRRNHQR